MTSEEKSASNHPYESLGPEVVLDALAGLGLYGDGRLMALNSYENRVYQAHLEDGRAVVLKFYRPGRWSDAQIAEEHRFSAELAAAEIPAVAPLALEGSTLHHHGGFAFSVSPYRGGRQPELDDFEVLEWVGRFLARIHTVGAARPFVERPALDLQTFGLASRDWLLEHQMIPLDVQRHWEKACTEAFEMIALTALGADTYTEMQKLRLHGDVHPGNILWTPTDRPDGGPHFVDLDDARTGFAVQDLWMLLSGDRAQRTAQLSGLLEGYEQFRPFDRRELALIEPLRTLRQIHYSAWLARRWQDPIFPINFPWFGSSDYWKEQIQMLQDQCEAMAEEPLYA
ncbi:MULTISPECIES: serine/threonine protein kinase [unclassified Variovorax]|uniref:serine/threonine protein kinase n=1 Tax=unclassified Variovorax TaxID=663243 RepID=UPI00076BEDB1|nr:MULTISPECIES: serine/threonine protein kinase [unclassified Variovorax]KWT98659.1 YihE protein, required for LPS synthesis [Variovorax sp. WDL1]PNG59387.1 Stress response kinase A [Variovorax sp. B4]PNG60822.1 Stress response kinase A [Variovorax sp. B2]VTV13259.1 serine/threonine protein kinase [Variovorax sp. WDL1]